MRGREAGLGGRADEREGDRLRRAAVAAAEHAPAERSGAGEHDLEADVAQRDGGEHPRRRDGDLGGRVAAGRGRRGGDGGVGQRPDGEDEDRGRDELERADEHARGVERDAGRGGERDEPEGGRGDRAHRQARPLRDPAARAVDAGDEHERHARGWRGRGAQAMRLGDDVLGRAGERDEAAEHRPRTELGEREDERGPGDREPGRRVVGAEDARDDAGVASTPRTAAHAGRTQSASVRVVQPAARSAAPWRRASRRSASEHAGGPAGTGGPGSAPGGPGDPVGAAGGAGRIVVRH